MRRVFHAVARNPLACLALAAMAGILVSNGDSWPTPAWFLVACGLAIITLWQPRPWLLALTTVAVFGLVNHAALLESRDHALRKVLQQGQRISAMVYGHFTRAPSNTEAARRQALFAVDEIELPARRLKITGAAVVTVWIADPAFKAEGGRYELKGTLNLVQRPMNPNLFDPEASALRRGIIAELSLQSSKFTDGPHFSLWLAVMAKAEECRAWIMDKLGQGIADQEMPRTVITTMALGTSEVSSADMAAPFRDSGTMHIFAVSGLHVALLAVIGWMFLKTTGLGRAKSVALLIPFIFGYSFITGLAPSAVRAAVMSAVVLVGPLLNRPSRLFNSLGLAALIIMAVEPQQFYQPGFQLSFGVIVAIGALGKFIGRPFARFAELDPYLPPMLASRAQRFSVWWRKQLLTTLSTSTAAWLGSLPLTVMHFHSCTPISIIANGVLVPLSSLSLFTVSLTMLAACCHLNAVVVLLNNANWLFAHAMMISANAFASIPGGHFPLNPPSWQTPPAMTLSVLSMPPGEAAQLLCSDNQNWMLDCGNQRHFKNTVQGFLRSQGVGTVDGLVLSHADSGHIGAAPSLLTANRKQPIIVGLHEPWKYDSRSTAMWQLAKAAKDQFKPLGEGSEMVLGNAKLHVLFPSVEDKHDKADNRALVVRIECANSRILWCNDAGFVAEKAMLKRLAPDELRCDVLIRNQHATDWSALEEFVIAVNPAVIVSSNSPRFAEEKLPDHLRITCQKHGICLMDLNETGMVRMEVDQQGMTVKPWAGGTTLRLGKTKIWKGAAEAAETGPKVSIQAE